MCDDKPLPAFHDRAPPDRYCDLILTGGVTSAIAYPSAIFALATTYRFNAIGGSSSGAGAAALAAAAEYRRRHGSSEGFRLLLERTDEVSHEFKDLNRKDHPKKDPTGLEWLFQPAKEHLRLFRALVPGFAKAESKGWGLLKGVAKAYARRWLLWLLCVTLVALALLGVNAGSLLFDAAQTWLRDTTAVAPVALAGRWAIDGRVLLGVLVGVLVGVAVGVLVGVTVVVAGILMAVWLIKRDVARLAKTDYGLCSGLKRWPEDAPRPPLTEWLHALIQEVAGLPRDGSPLTFADLADAPGSPRETMGDMSGPGKVSIRLEMFTANITHGRPYVFPQSDDDEPQHEKPLYFKPCEMRRLFPEPVVEHMKKHSTQTIDNTSFPAKITLAKDDNFLWRLPTKQLPIVVAARMSVSFPVLFMAVPFWALDSETGRYRRCLFADGSLCSNFPIHLFDSPVPSWPTFGISLRKLPKVGPGAARAPDEGCCELHGRSITDVVKLPGDHGRVPERWNAFDEEAGDYGKLKGFIGAMFDTTTDWKDALQARLLGVRDRVVQVGLPADVGGLNILMTPQQIHCLAELGGEAAKKLLKRFAEPSAQGASLGWAEHRWVRFNLLRECLSSMLSGLSWSADQTRHTEPLREQIRRAIDDVPLRGRDESRLLAAQAAALEGVLAALKAAERMLNAPGTGQPSLPPERPVLQIRPQL